jgi:tricorn protease
VSANTEKALYRQGTSWIIASTATLGQPQPPGAAGASAPGAPHVLKTSEMEVYVDPRVEWQQMYREAWRIVRDFFYDPNYHGLDLEATAGKYAPYVDTLAHRADLNYLFQEVFGELSVGHLYVSGGDVPNPNRVAGDLRLRLRHRKRALSLAKIYDGENWNGAARAPYAARRQCEKANICWPSVGAI